jgi:hypothetical protein
MARAGEDVPSLTGEQSASSPLALPFRRSESLRPVSPDIVLASDGTPPA